VNGEPTTYVVRVVGHLDDHWSTWLGEPEITREADGTTTITASIADQAQLYGVLAGLRDIGAILSEIRAISAVTGDPPSLGQDAERAERSMIS
jgi:hypothetical protein